MNQMLFSLLQSFQQMQGIPAQLSGISGKMEKGNHGQAVSHAISDQVFSQIFGQGQSSTLDKKTESAFPGNSGAAGTLAEKITGVARYGNHALPLTIEAQQVEASEALADLLSDGQELGQDILLPAEISSRPIAGNGKSKEATPALEPFQAEIATLVLSGKLHQAAQAGAIPASSVPDIRAVIDNPAMVAAAGGQQYVVQAVAGEMLGMARHSAETPALSEGARLAAQVDGLLDMRPSEGISQGPEKPFPEKPFSAMAESLLQKRTSPEGVEKSPSPATASLPSVLPEGEKFIAMTERRLASAGQYLSSASEDGTDTTGQSLMAGNILQSTGNGQNPHGGASTASAAGQPLLQEHTRIVPEAGIAGTAGQDAIIQPDPLSRFQGLTTSLDSLSREMESTRQATPREVLAQVKFGVAQAVETGAKQISIQLSPRELGRVDVHMETSKEGKTRVAIIAERTDTLNLLQKEADSLRHILQDTLKTENSQLSFSFHDQSQQDWRQQFADGFKGTGGNLAGVAAESELPGQEVMAYIISREQVDIRV